MLLYPRAMVNAIVSWGTGIPTFCNLLDVYNLNNLKGVKAADIQCLEGLIKESTRQKPAIADPNKIAQIYSTMLIAILITMLGVKAD
ncbi:hypothetical protein Ancab_025376, partial [Ancistrocladus abbreviatus]